MGHAPGGTRGSMSLNAACHKEQQYIWFMGEDLNSFWDITHFMKWRGWGIPPGDPLGIHGPCHLMRLIIRNKNIYGLEVGIWMVSKILSISWNEGGGACTRGTPRGPKIHVTEMLLILRNKNIYGLWVGSERFPRYNTFYEMKRVGPAPWGPPWDPWSMSLNGPHHKEQEYIWFMGIWMVSKILFVCVEVLRPSQPNGVMSSAVSLPYHTFTGQT